MRESGGVERSPEGGLLEEPFDGGPRGPPFPVSLLASSQTPSETGLNLSKPLTFLVYSLTLMTVSDRFVRFVQKEEIRRPCNGDRKGGYTLGEGKLLLFRGKLLLFLVRNVWNRPSWRLEASLSRRTVIYVPEEEKGVFLTVMGGWSIT